MTRREAEILASLDVAGRPWLRPRDFGGSTASHHPVTAARMVEKGWLERRPHLGYLRAAQLGLQRQWAYRVTDQGAQALANHQILQPYR